MNSVTADCRYYTVVTENCRDERKEIQWYIIEIATGNRFISWNYSLHIQRYSRNKMTAYSLRKITRDLWIRVFSGYIYKKKIYRLKVKDTIGLMLLLNGHCVFRIIWKIWSMNVSVMFRSSINFQTYSLGSEHVCKDLLQLVLIALNVPQWISLKLNERLKIDWKSENLLKD